MECNVKDMGMKKLVYILILITMATTNATADKIVDIKTSLGDIKIKLYDDTPIHRDNFLKLVKEGYYDGVLFHRVIKNFMIQTGDPDSKTADSTAMLGSGSPDYTLEAEIKYPTHFHKRGALAAARTGDQVNPEKRSSGSQFYIVTGEKQSAATLKRLEDKANQSRKQAYFNNLAKQHMDELMALRQANDREGFEALRTKLAEETDSAVKDIALPDEIRGTYLSEGGTPHLDGEYTVFGEVIEGMETVDKIQNVVTGRADRPKEDIRIISMTLEK